MRPAHKTETPGRFSSPLWFRSLLRHGRQAAGIALAGRPTRQGQSHAGFTPIPRDQPVRRALAQLIREFARIPGTRPATLPSLLPQAALEKTVMEVTRDAADDRTPATSGEPAAAAFVLRRRGA